MIKKNTSIKLSILLLLFAVFFLEIGFSAFVSDVAEFYCVQDCKKELSSGEVVDVDDGSLNGGGDYEFVEAYYLKNSGLFVNNTKGNINLRNYLKNYLKNINGVLIRNSLSTCYTDLEVLEVFPNLVPIELKSWCQIQPTEILTIQPQIEGTGASPIFVEANGNIVFEEEVETQVVFKKDTQKLELNGEEIIIPISQSKSITIINDTGTRQKLINSTEIALVLHKITNLKTKAETQELLKNIITVMHSLNITKRITYDEARNVSIITITLNNISSAQQRDLTLYEIIPKSVAQDISKIKHKTVSGNGVYFVYDTDPAVGWAFNYTRNNENIKYEIDGRNEGGEVILFLQPQLFNEGNLIVNYRQENCNANELFFFKTSALENASISVTNNNFPYSVCLSYLNNDTILHNTQGSINITFASFDDIVTSKDITELQNKLQLFAQNTTPIYFDVKVQEQNPKGDYSCLGSFNLNIKKFGDCGYIKNQRIWIHLWADISSPTTFVPSPRSLGSVVKLQLEAIDTQGSGINSTTYCIENASTCEWKNYTQGEIIILQCEQEAGCTKILKYYSTDNANNVEETKENKYILLEQGNFCAQDCTAKPKPGRFFQSCNQINFCEFKYHINDTRNSQLNGTTVAKNCHLLPIGAYVSYNDTHEIKCPNGPFRESVIISEDIIISGCNTLLTKKYPVLFEGKPIFLNIHFCYI